MNRIALVVDDVQMNRDILADMLEDDFSIIEAGDGEEALRLLEEHGTDVSVILLDLLMPKMSGMEVLERLRESELHSRIPVLIISGETAPEAEQKCFDYGVSDFIHKPFNAVLVRRRVLNAVELYNYKNHLEDTVEEQTHALKEQAAKLLEQNTRIQEINEEIIEFLGNVVEARHFESGLHVKRVKFFTQILAEYVCQHFPEYGLNEHLVKVICSASALHDVGKVMISDAVLLKPGRFTPEEMELMKTHTVKGCEIIKHAPQRWDAELSKYCDLICHYHHEKWDGKGYPEGLVGEEIPIAAQIVSVADCYDALVTERVYKRAFSKEQAFDMITGGQCGQFSPKLMQAFRDCRAKMEAQVDSGAESA